MVRIWLTAAQAAHLRLPQRGRWRPGNAGWARTIPINSRVPITPRSATAIAAASVSIRPFHRPASARTSCQLTQEAESRLRGCGRQTTGVEGIATVAFGGRSANALVYNVFYAVLSGGERIDKPHKLQWLTRYLPISANYPQLTRRSRTCFGRPQAHRPTVV
jgi:hypothetical protein